MEMRKLCLHTAVLAILVLCAIPAFSQTTECPANMVCLPAERARYYLTLEDTVKAKDAEILTLKQANIDQREITIDTKIALAKAIGEKTQLEAERVRWTAVVDVLIKNSRPKKFGVINF